MSEPENEQDEVPAESPTVDWFVRICIGLAVFGVSALVLSWGVDFYESPSGQRLLGIKSCQAFSLDAEQLLERVMLQEKLLLAEALGPQFAANVPTDVELVRIREEPVQPGESLARAISREMVCVAVSSVYNPVDNTVSRTEVRYTVAPRADGGSGYHVRIVDQTDIE